MTAIHASLNFMAQTVASWPLAMLLRLWCLSILPVLMQGHPSKRRGRPHTHPYLTRLRIVLLRETACRLCLRFALPQPRLLAADHRDLAKLPAELQAVVRQATGRHGRYLTASARRYAADPPVHEPWWTAEDKNSKQKREDWQTRVYGHKWIARAGRAAAERGDVKRRPLSFLEDIRPPVYVGKLVRDIDAIIAEAHGIAPRTLRHWVREMEQEPCRTPKVRREKARRRSSTLNYCHVWHNQWVRNFIDSMARMCDATPEGDHSRDSFRSTHKAVRSAHDDRGDPSAEWDAASSRPHRDACFISRLRSHQAWLRPETHVAGRSACCCVTSSSTTCWRSARSRPSRPWRS